MPESDGMSVGNISLDLVIRNRIGKQLDRIKQNVSAGAESIGKAIEAAIEEPMEAAGKAASDSVSKAVKAAEKAVSEAELKLPEPEFTFDGTEAVRDLDEIIREANERYRKSLNLDAEIRPRKDDKPHKPYISYDQNEIAKQIEEWETKTAEASERAGRKLKQPVEEAAEAIKEKLADIGRYEVSTEPAERLRKETELISTQLDLLQKKWQELSAAEPTDKIKSQLVSVEMQIISSQDKLDRLRKKLEDMSDPVPPTITEHIDEAVERSGRTAERESKRIKRSFGSAFGHISSTGKKAAASLNKRFAVFSRSAGAAVSPVAKLGTALKNTFRRVFLMAGIYAAFRTLKEKLKEAAEANESFRNSLNDIKANLAIAFTPIVQAIMPALNTLMSGLAMVSKQIAGFIAGLFGMTYRQAAEATKKLNATTSAAKKAKLALAGIDEMNILSSGDDDKDKGIDLSRLDMSEPEIPDWAQRLKDAIKKGDWNGAGKILADRVNAALDTIDWDAAERKAVAGVSKVCDGINGFLDNLNWRRLGENIAGGINIATAVINTLADKIHWENLGRNIAQGLNAVIAKIKWRQLGRALSAKIRILTDILYGFVTEFNWNGLGAGIGEAVNGWFDGIDFGKIGKTVSEGLKGIFTAASAVLRTVNFRGIGGKIADLINNIDIAGILSKAAETFSSLVKAALELASGILESTDWARLGKQIVSAVTGVITAIDWRGIIRGAFELIGAVIGAERALTEGLYEKIFELLASAWDAVKNYFNDKIEECGGNVIKGVFKGITDALVNVGKWISDNILSPFLDGFRKAFGIRSPSRVMAAMGGYIIDGLYNGIAAGIVRIKAVFTEMRDTITGVFEHIHEWFGEKFKATYEKIKDAFRFIGNWFSEKFSDARSRVNAAFVDIGTWFAGRWTDISSAFSGTRQFFADTFSAARAKIEDAFSNIGSWFKDRWNAVKFHFSDVGDWFKDKFTAAYDNITGVFNELPYFFAGIWDRMRNSARDGINSIIEKVEEGFNYPIESLMAMPKIKLPLIGEIDFGSALDYIHLPRLASGGLATAPTLAMVGDNRNAAVDPEVVAPLSKLQGMIDAGGSEEIIALLREILALLRSGLSAELIGTLFGSDLKRVVLKIIADDKARRGAV